MFIKRCFDLIAAGLALIVLSPVIALISLIIYIRMGRPIFFRQARAGLNEKEFFMIKFRSMGNPFDDNGNPIPDNKRTGKLGHFLRASSLDELPELWNIVRGDMSLVGPRPLLIEYLPYYTKQELKRHAVRPGLTGLAQVSGRNNLDWDERLKLDIQYVEKQSFLMDLKIIALTAKKVFARSDVQVITGGTNRLDKTREKRNDYAKK